MCRHKLFSHSCHLRVRKRRCPPAMGVMLRRIKAGCQRRALLGKHEFVPQLHDSLLAAIHVRKLLQQLGKSCARHVSIIAAPSPAAGATGPGRDRRRCPRRAATCRSRQPQTSRCDGTPCKGVRNNYPKTQDRIILTIWRTGSRRAARRCRCDCLSWTSSRWAWAALPACRLHVNKLISKQESLSFLRSS